MASRIRVLVSAYACEPGRGSEPGVGWNWVRQIGRFHDVWAITRANQRSAIERFLEGHPLPNVHWVYFDLPRWMRFWKRGQSGVHAYYYLWQIGAAYLGRRLNQALSFDLAHHVTFVNYWLPSGAALVSVPFVWGPVGGGESAPRSLCNSLGTRQMAYEAARGLARALGQRDPLVRVAAKRATVALATTDETARRLRQMGAGCVRVSSAVGLSGEEIDLLGALPLRRNQPLRLASIGRMLDWKGFDLGLMAFARFQRAFRESEYWMIGSGPAVPRLRRLSDQLGIDRNVRWSGSVTREQVLAMLTECDVLVHPSLHDSGGWVCLEAMAAGRPVICLDLGGPAVEVADQTGIRVPAISAEQVVGDLAAAMVRLASDAGLRANMADAARQRVATHFLWDKRGEWIHQLYENVLASS